MTEQPRTAAGRALLGKIDEHFHWQDGAPNTFRPIWRDRILAIEAEASESNAAEPWRVERARRENSNATGALRALVEHANDKGWEGENWDAARAVLDAAPVPKPQPDGRPCRCGHVGSVHRPAKGAPTTDLGYAIEGTGPCFGRDDAGKPCKCIAAAYLATLPQSDSPEEGTE